MFYSYVSPRLVPAFSAASCPRSQLVRGPLPAAWRVGLLLLLSTTQFRLHANAPGRQVGVGRVAEIVHLEAGEILRGFLARGVRASW